MARIRVGFIGLSKPSAGNMARPGMWSVTAHLPSLLQQKDKYEITALCNSSVESAKASIAGWGLSDSTAAYGDPVNLANDPNVDLVVVSVFVGKHFELAKPALEAGKMVYVEAPLGASVHEAEDLAALAKEKGVRTMVATQGRGSAAVAHVRQLLADDEIGEVISSSLLARAPGYTSIEPFPASFAMQLDLDNVVNIITIGLTHIYDTHQHLLGHLKSYSALLEYKGGPRQICDDVGSIVDNVQPTSPNHIFLQGKLESGALASIVIRPNRKPQSLLAPDLSDDSYFRWIITGTKGEIEVTAPDVMWQMTGSTARVFLTKSNQRTEVHLPREHGDQVEFVAENTAAQYAAFARGDKSRYADFEDAAELARFIEDLREIARNEVKA